MLARDKGLFKIILAYHRILTPEFVVFPMGCPIELPPILEYPVIVKSISEDASLGISQASVVKNDKELEARITFLHKHFGTPTLAERYIEGRELYVGIMGYDQLEVLPVWELLLDNLPKTAWRIATGRVKWSPKYQKKYGIKSQAALGLTKEMVETIQAEAKRVYQILGLSGYARIDLRLDPTGTMYVLEANPNPQIGRGEDFGFCRK